MITLSCDLLSFSYFYEKTRIVPLLAHFLISVLRPPLYSQSEGNQSQAHDEGPFDRQANPGFSVRSHVRDEPRPQHDRTYLGLSTCVCAEKEPSLHHRLLQHSLRCSSDGFVNILSCSLNYFRCKKEKIRDLNQRFVSVFHSKLKEKRRRYSVPRFHVHVFLVFRDYYSSDISRLLLKWSWLWTGRHEHSCTDINNKSAFQICGHLSPEAQAIHICLDPLHLHLTHPVLLLHNVHFSIRQPLLLVSFSLFFVAKHVFAQISFRPRILIVLVLHNRRSAKLFEWLWSPA